MPARLILLAAIGLAGAAIVADYASSSAGGAAGTPTRHGDGAARPAAQALSPFAPPAAAEVPVPVVPVERPRFCGFAPCGMPLECPD